MKQHSFSKTLENWLKSSEPKTIRGLTKVLDDRSFALLFVLLMATAALPIPTGGITHVFELIVMLLAIELILGRSTIWLPRSWADKQLGSKLVKSGLPKLIDKIRWVEKRSKPRLGNVINHHYSLRLIGFIVLVLAATAFIAPPFSGLDTLPALGIVLIGLGLILEDGLVFLAGAISGAVGIGLVLALSDLIIRSVGRLL